MNNNQMKYQLEQAIALATEKHSGQTDKAGMPYILHPLRVMMSVQREHYEQNQPRKYLNMCIAAVLHDVVEDTDISLEEISMMGFDREVTYILSLLTKGKSEPYSDYIQRIKESRNVCAIIIKRADLKDNMEKSRLLKPLSEEDQKRLDKYSAADEELYDAFLDLI